MRHVAGGFSPEFWSAPAVASALARCDFPLLLEEIRRARGRLAGEAMAAGMRYDSERVLQGSRQFRRGYAGPVTAQVHDFDQRLQATFS